MKINSRVLAKNELFKQFGEPKTINELGMFFVKAGSSIAKNDIVGLKFTVDYSPRVSNTHSCPANGVQNFMQTPDKPKHYPGLHGRVWVRLRENPHTLDSMWASDYLARAFLNTGTGGGGGYGGPWEHLNSKLYRTYGYLKKRPSGGDLHIYSWDCKIFTEDFPEIDSFFGQKYTLATLRGEPMNSQQITFEWQDEDVKKRDAELWEMLHSGEGVQK